MGRSFQECVDELQQIAVRGYGQRLPGPSDEVFKEIAKWYIAAEPVRRKQMRESIPKDCFLVIVGFSDRFAMMAERGKNEELLRIGYVAHAIEGFRYDARENILRLALLAHVARKIGCVPNEMVDWAAPMGSDEAKVFLASFKQRPAEINTLETMGIKETNTPSGVVYEYRL